MPLWMCECGTARQLRDVGLFPLLQTVSSVPRARPSAFVEPRSRSMDRAASIEAGFFPPPPSRRRLSDETNETSSSKKRDGKKWTLGGLFRRRKKKPEADAAPGESESSSGAEEERGGFLSKRRSRRDTKRKPKLVGTFDHVVMPPPPRPQQQQQHQNQQTQPQQHSTDVNGNLESSLDRLSARSSKESLSVVQHRRQESSGGSGSMDGGGGGGTTRRERREIAKARMEAQRGGGGGGGADSSSEDDADRRSPSVSTGPGKRTRGARTERYIARLHKSDGGSRDLKSATPSPAHSPSVRHRQPQLTPPTHHDAATCTFPPGKAAQYSPRTLGVSSRPIPRGPSPVLSAARSVDSATRRPWHGGGAVVSSGSHDNICAARTNISQHTSAPTAHADQRRSQSFDSNIHRASQQTPPEEVLVVQFPIARPHTFMTKQTTQTVAPPPPPPPRDPLRKVSTTIVAGVDPPRPMSYAFETGGGAGGSSLSELQYKPYFLHQQQQPLWASSVSYQRRSGSDNQIAAAASNGANPPPPRLQAPTPTRPRPSSVTPESPRMQQRNRRTPPPPQILQYYADQYPRSRRPIQLLQFGSSGSGDQPYLSDSQVSANSTPQQHFLRHPSAASDFWRQKELEASTNTTATSAATSLMRQRKPMLANTKAYHNGNNHLHANNHYLQNLSNSYHQQNNQLMHNQTNNHHQLQLNSAAHPLLQHQRNDRSRSNSPQTRDRNGVDVVREKALKLRIPAASHGRTVASTDSQSSLSSQSDVASPVQPGKIFGDANSGSAFLRPLSKVVENGVTPSRIVPPTPPVRRFSRQNSNSSLEVTEQLGRDKSPDPAEKKRRSTNLEEALSELEAIYNSLRLGDEDLLDRAERRDLPSAPGAAGWGRGAESDSGFSYGYGEDSELFTGRRRRAPPLRRAGVPDRVADDMAYRRLNPKDRMSVLQDARNLVSQSGSYLQAAPVLSSNDTTPTTPTSAPDVTFDDVLYRNIRHTNNTLKISDPQLPFGIPVGPVTAAAPSDYLHATPASDAASSYRPTFRPRKVPDVVKDDLAYRNLRKDPNRDSAALPSGNDDDVGGGASVLYYARNDDGNFTLRKKRAIRSLSANLMGFIHREPPPITTGVTSLSTDQDFEKAQSFADLPDAVQVAQRILEGKDVIGGGVGKFGRRLTSPVHGGGDRTPQQRFVADRNSVCGGTSTETLTDSRINLAEKRNSFQNRLRVFVPGSDGKPPVYVASPRASPSIMPRPTIEEGDSHMEDLLTAMAHEARATSEKLDLELKQLGREEKLRDEEPEKDAGKAAEAAEGVQKPVHQEAKDEEMVQENDESVTEAREDKANEEEAQAVAGVCEIRNISCDGSVLISEIVRRQRYHEEDDGKDQQVPEVSSDEEADLEVARATAGWSSAEAELVACVGVLLAGLSFLLALLFS